MNYHKLYQSGELLQRIRKAYLQLTNCDLCPHCCGINRIKGELGICNSGLKPKIASATLHNGEEPPISGTRGSGTIFFSGCSLKCIFCQNFPISQLGNGQEISTSKLASRMMKLQKQGVHNINFVTPTHFMPQILAALWLAIPQGFKLPILWNTSGYEKVDSLKLLDGIVSIYLADMKYSSDEQAVAISLASGYREINRQAVQEMLNQVGQLEVNNEEVAVKGLIIRHLVLPEQKAGTLETLEWIAKNLGTETHISLMKQYFPAHKAHTVIGLDRKINNKEYDQCSEWLEEYGFENGWVQE